MAREKKIIFGPKLFPSLSKNKDIQKSWKDFTVLTEHLSLAEEQLSTDQR